MRAIVIGAGAWGLPTATRLAEAGVKVTLIDRWGPGNSLSSSPGPSRIWRLADHRPDRVELSRYGLEALERSEKVSGTKLFTTSGILWRHEASNEAAFEGLSLISAPVERVPAKQVGDFFSGLKPSAVDAVWSPVAGTLLADKIIASELERFKKAGGKTLFDATVVEVFPDETPGVLLQSGEELTADVIVIAPGMGAKALIDPLLPKPLPFATRLEQVVHFGTKDTLTITDHLPCIFDGATEAEPGMYGMATPGVGYKFGLDTPIRNFDITDPDRTPSPERTERLTARIARDFDIAPVVVDAQVCNWTDSPDSEFLIDRLPGNIVIGAGDSGEGFKFTSIIGETLAALALGKAPQVDIKKFNVDRFATQEFSIPGEGYLAMDGSAPGGSALSESDLSQSTSFRKFGE